MPCLNRRALMIFTLVIVLGWASNAGAHRRGGLPLVHPVPPPTAQPQTPQEGTCGPLSLKPDAYWQRLKAQEQAGDIQEAIKTGLALTNIFPLSPQRGAALLKLGELAQGQGRPAEALEFFGLVISLSPGTPEASQACLSASALELARDLRQGNPIRSLRQFLGRTSHLSPGYSPESLQEALRTGWQAVTHQVRATSPLPLSLVEEILALWDMQPQGLRPPEAARLLADLLQENGLLEEAQTLLARAGDKNGSNQQNLLKSLSWNRSWLPGGWAGLAEALNLAPPREEEQKFLLPAWRPRWQAAVEPAAIPGEALLTWFLPRPANAAWLEGQIPAPENNLLHSWNPVLPARPHAEVARYYLPGGSFSRALSPSQPLVDKLRGDQGPYAQYCLGVNRLQGGHPDEAQATFQELAQNHDPFWQSLARVRLADLELSRLQAEPAP
jgi:tetratricopeptide (TPR) repeat protein